MFFSVHELGRILRTFTQNESGLYVKEEPVTYSLEAKEGKEKKWIRFPKRIVRLHIDTNTMTATADAMSEMTPSTLEEVGFIGNGLGRTSKKFAPYYYARDWKNSPLFSRTFYEGVIHWQEKKGILLYNDEILGKIKRICDEFPFDSADLYGMIKEAAGVKKKAEEMMVGIILLHIDGVPLYEDERFREQAIPLVSSFHDVNQDGRYTCAVTGQQGIPLSPDLGKTVIGFATRTDPYHYQFQVSSKKKLAMQNFLLCEDSVRNYMAGAMFMENFLSFQGLTKDPKVNSAYYLPSFEEPLTREDEEAVFYVLEDIKQKHRSENGPGRFQLISFIELQEQFDAAVCGEKNVTFELLLFHRTETGALKIARHLNKVRFQELKAYIRTFKEEVYAVEQKFPSKLFSFLYPNSPLFAEAGQHQAFFNELFDLSIYGNRTMLHSYFIRESIGFITEGAKKERRTYKSAKEGELKMMEFIERWTWRFFILEQTYRRLGRLRKEKQKMEQHSQLASFLEGQLHKFNQKYEEFSGIANLNDAEKAWYYLGAVIRRIFDIERERINNTTVFQLNNLQPHQFPVLLKQAFERIRLFERQEYEKTGPIGELLERANMHYQVSKGEGMNSYEAIRMIHLGQAVTRLYFGPKKDEQQAETTESAEQITEV